MFTYNQIFKNKHNILVVTAHPDDTVVYFAGLIHKLRQDKKKVYVLVITDGSKGSQDKKISNDKLAGLRHREEIAALKILGVEENNFVHLGYKDGEVESNYKLIGDIVKYIRKYKADIVCTHEPTVLYKHTYANDGFFVQHRDHRKVGEAVLDAVYPFSRDRSFFPELEKEGIEPHNVYNLLFTDEAACNFDFDYTLDLETKKATYRAHKSQFTSEKMIQAWVNDNKFGEKYLEKFNYVKLLW